MNDRAHDRSRRPCHRHDRCARRSRLGVGSRSRPVDGWDDRPDPRDPAPGSGAHAHLDHVLDRAPGPAAGQPEAMAALMQAPARSRAARVSGMRRTFPGYRAIGVTGSGLVLDLLDRLFHQLVHGPRFLGARFSGSGRFHLTGNPCFVIRFRNDVYHDRHKAVIGAT